MRYSLLALTVVFYIGGWIFLVGWLDPYSNFGRVCENVFRPAYIRANNIIANILEKNGVYSLYQVKHDWPPVTMLAVVAVYLIAVFWLAWKKGRLYCNTVCPVGALLGIFSKFAIFKIKIKSEDCTACGICARVCKAECIDKNEREVDFTRCVACFNCITACPGGGLKYIYDGPARKREAAAKTDTGKRAFLRSAAAGVFGLCNLGMAKMAAPIPVAKKNPVSPPGSKSLTHFNNACTACQLCVANCPTRVLQPAILEYGIAGVMQSRMDYQISYCNYECNLCGQICPTGAIQPLALEKKKLAQIGVAKFIHANCIVYRKRTECGACAEHCPTRAAHMIPYEDLNIPEVTEDLCIGCGACEYACPAEPFKAIFVEGNREHKTARKPDNGETKPKERREDFPF